jgi:hypothetical protein
MEEMGLDDIEPLAPQQSHESDDLARKSEKIGIGRKVEVCAVDRNAGLAKAVDESASVAVSRSPQHRNRDDPATRAAARKPRLHLPSSPQRDRAWGPIEPREAGLSSDRALDDVQGCGAVAKQAIMLRHRRVGKRSSV